MFTRGEGALVELMQPAMPGALLSVPAWPAAAALRSTV